MLFFLVLQISADNRSPLLIYFLVLNSIQRAYSGIKSSSLSINLWQLYTPFEVVKELASQLSAVAEHGSSEGRMRRGVATPECQEFIVKGHSHQAKYLLGLLFGFHAVICQYITELLEIIL